MTASTHINRLQVGGFTFEPDSLSLDLDEDRVPYALMRATLPIDSRDRDVTTNGRGQFGPRDIFAEDPESWWFNPHGVPGPADTVLVDGQWVTTWTAPSSALPHSRTSFQYVPVQGLYSYTAHTRVMADVDLLTATMVVELVREGGWFAEVGRVTLANIPAGQWQQLEVEFAAPERPEYIHVHVETRAVDGYAIGDQLRQDGVQLYRASPVLTLDPRTSPPQRVHVGLTQAFGYGRPVADLSAFYAGQTLAEMEIAPTVIAPDDGSFEYGISEWEPSDGGAGTTIAWTDAQAHTGTHSMEITNPAGGSATAWTTDMFPIETLVRWYWRAWVYPTTPITLAQLRRYYYDADGVEYVWVGTAIANPPVGQWTRLGSGFESVPSPIEAAGYRFARMEIRLSGTNPHAYVDDVTFRYGRMGLASFTTEYGEPFNPGGWRPSTRVRANLHLRDRTVDYAAGTVEIVAASADALLTDYALTATTAMTPSGSTIRDCCNMVLGHVLGVALPAGPAGSQLVETDALPWQPGEGAWSYLSGIIGIAGLRLWCDERGLWHLEDPEVLIVPGVLAASPLTATDLTDALSREQGGWGDSAVVTYEWDDAGTGQRRTRYDAAGVTGTRTITRTVERPYPGAGLARGILRRARALGRVLGLGGVSDYSVRPYQPFLMTMPDGGVQAGAVAAVSWSQPDDVMTVRTRDLLGIDQNSYLYTPPGVSYDDVPAGTSYTEYAWEG
ncbi:hypothetical protein [Jiangella sp. DSM 45060]|uniref:hypothetical protein n=1 Tax=Jiangella sp. DSM 45060 TaxID=1798224 RepID=UPI00087A7C88|nr:hypothetical protein [Jiangella sp. DSM 45060]SDT69437.1 hypothetical protein SAMN04515669_6021 [Jiangella sp. DSM 45060]